MLLPAALLFDSHFHSCFREQTDIFSLFLALSVLTAQSDLLKQEAWSGLFKSSNTPRYWLLVNSIRGENVLKGKLQYFPVNVSALSMLLSDSV